MIDTFSKCQRKLPLLKQILFLRQTKCFSDINNNTLNVIDKKFCYGNNQFFENLRFWAHVMIDTF